MESSDSRKDSGSDGESTRGAQGDGATTTRRKLNDSQEREVTRLYAETETPVSEISKRFGIGESSVYRVAQRHGAKLRGRSSTPAKPSARPAAKAAAPTTAASTGRGGRRRGPGRATAAATTRGRAAAAAAPAKPAATPSGNGRR